MKTIRKYEIRSTRLVVQQACRLSFFLFLGIIPGCQAENGHDMPEQNRQRPANQVVTADSAPFSNDVPGGGPDLSFVPSRSQQGDIYRAGEDIGNSRRNAITRAVEVCSPAIVGINVTELRQYRIRDPWLEFFYGRRYGGNIYEQEVKGLGSGFIISPDGYILTNEHVAGGADKIVVTMTNGEKYDAKLIGSDAVSDIALLKIDGHNLPYLRFADSDDVIIGEWAIAFGNPFGLFDINAKPTVTVGVVSNTGVNFMNDDKVYRNMIQTDAAISSGNSGGPLVNSSGQVIGMNAAIYSTSQSERGAGSIGIGFAIPSKRVRNIVELLKRDGKIERNFTVGFNIATVDQRVAKALNLERERGVYISEIYTGSPADDAGLEPGDIILQIDDLRILGEQDVRVVVNDGMEGQVLNMQIMRDNKKINKQLRLAGKRGGRR